MKYVIVDRKGLETPIIFPEHVDHGIFNNMHPVSAGFVQFYGTDKPKPGSACCENAIDVHVWGKSVGLNLASRPEDEAILVAEIMRHYH